MGEVEEVLAAAGAEGESSMAVGIAFVVLDMQGVDGNGIRDPTTYDTRPPGRSIFWINDLILRPWTVGGLLFCVSTTYNT